jgi:hypothetical protein
MAGNSQHLRLVFCEFRCLWRRGLVFLAGDAAAELFARRITRGAFSMLRQMCFALGTLGCASVSLASPSELVVIGGTDLNRYGSSDWSSMTSLIDGGFDTVTVTSSITDAAVANADAMWVDIRGAFTALPADELAALSDFIASGRRVVFMGENVLWADWIVPVIAPFGGSFDGGTVFANALPTGAAPELTDGVTDVEIFSAGIASGGTALFDQNWATLWSDNFLTLLDSNVFDDVRFENNQAFAGNVVNWLSVPTPGTAGLLGLAAAAGLRRRR